MPGSTADSMPHFVTCGASLSPCGTYLVDLVGNDLLSPGLKSATFALNSNNHRSPSPPPFAPPSPQNFPSVSSRLGPTPSSFEQGCSRQGSSLGDKNPKQQGPSFQTEASSAAKIQLARDQSSLYHYNVRTGEVHVVVPNLKRRRGSFQPLKVAWHSGGWPGTRLVYACTDFSGTVMWVDARLHRLLGTWDKPTLLQPILRPSEYPPAQPSGHPSNQPGGYPSKQPGGDPSKQPSDYPSKQPNGHPLVHPPDGGETSSDRSFASPDQHSAARISAGDNQPGYGDAPSSLEVPADPAESHQHTSVKQSKQTAPSAAMMAHQSRSCEEASAEGAMDQLGSAWHRQNPLDDKAGEAVKSFEADGDWSELVWSPDGLQLACIAGTCLVAISLKTKGNADPKDADAQACYASH